MMNDADIHPLGADAVARRLVDELGYRDEVAPRVAAHLTSLNPAVQTAFWRWWRTGSLEPPIEVAGYTVPQLMAEFQLNPVAAFSALDGLARDPRTTLATLRRGLHRRQPRACRLPPSPPCVRSWAPAHHAGWSGTSISNRGLGASPSRCPR
jgi:hypothetical protein